MILDEKVKVHIAAKNLTHYSNLGYNVRVNDFLDVLIDELPKNSRFEVNVKCDLCDKVTKMTLQRYNRTIKKFGYYKCNNHKSLCSDYIKFDTTTERHIIEMYNQDVKIDEIVDIFNISSSSQFHRILRRNGREKILPGKKYKFNESYFKLIDNENKAYWLGFLFADGCVRKRGNSFNIELKIATKDKEHLLKFKQDIEYNGDIKDSHIERLYKGEKVVYYASYLFLSSKIMFEDLNNSGCVERKSLILKPPKNIPNDMFPHFIRGYFDGDGFVSNYFHRKRKEYKIGILGTYDFLSWVNDVLFQNGVSKRNISVRNKINLIQYNTKDKNNIFNFLYNNSTIFLERKYKKFN